MPGTVCCVDRRERASERARDREREGGGRGVRQVCCVGRRERANEPVIERRERERERAGRERKRVIRSISLFSPAFCPASLLSPSPTDSSPSLPLSAPVGSAARDLYLMEVRERERMRERERARTHAREKERGGETSSGSNVQTGGNTNVRARCDTRVGRRGLCRSWDGPYSWPSWRRCRKPLHERETRRGGWRK